MKLKYLLAVGVVLSLSATLNGQGNFPQGHAQDFIRVNAETVALDHLLVIDGTGAPPAQDQTIVIAGGKIASIGSTVAVQVPPGARRIDFTGYSAIPGLVGMHDHLFYLVSQPDGGFLVHDMPFSYPRLYLAAGVTTIRTTGSYEPYTDLAIKQAIDQGNMIGPKINVTAPYLEGEGLGQIQVHTLAGPDDARRTVDYWASEGVGSIKVYTHITRAELKAAIEEAHAHGLTVAGHLCSIGFAEAAEMGIDSLEHGLLVDNEFDPNKKPDVCPGGRNSIPQAEGEIDDSAIQNTIKTLVQHHVAITSTLPVFEALLGSRPGASPRVLVALSDEEKKSYAAYRAGRVRDAEASSGPGAVATRNLAALFRREMRFEVAFVRAGGLLMAGPDGVLGGVIAGFGDQREVELLVESGFTTSEAIQIATLNGARFLRQADHIGSLAVGKQADIVIIKGDPSVRIEDIENVEVVFKDGVGYDSKKLIQSVAGQVGIR